MAKLYQKAGACLEINTDDGLNLLERMNQSRYNEGQTKDYTWDSATALSLNNMRSYKSEPQFPDL